MPTWAERFRIAVSVSFAILGTSIPVVIAFILIGLSKLDMSGMNHEGNGAVDAFLGLGMAAAGVAGAVTSWLSGYVTRASSSHSHAGPTVMAGALGFIAIPLILSSEWLQRSHGKLWLFWFLLPVATALGGTFVQKRLPTEAVALAVAIAAMAALAVGSL